MMFDTVSEGFGKIFSKLKSHGVISDKALDLALAEMRDMLLEADVALSVCDDFLATTRKEASGRKIAKSLSPVQLLTTIIYELLQKILGEESKGLSLSGSLPMSLLMIGLQGVGKTTSCVKLGYWIQKHTGKKTMVVSLDERRPAAREQLAILAVRAGIASLPIIEGEAPSATTSRAFNVAKLSEAEILIFDTPGRQQIDREGLSELTALKKQINPLETLFCVDAMTGQDASIIAKGVHDAVGLSGIILTRMDGDARGGAALSMRGVTGCPIRFFTTGEKINDFELFHPERMARRILGMGDLDTLLEKVRDSSEGDPPRPEKKIAKNFTLDDMADELRRMQKMGGVEKLLDMLPGKSSLPTKNIPDMAVFRKQGAIISSMTPLERRNPNMILASRKRRIAKGSGTSLQEVNKLLKQHLTMSKMMKRMSRLQAGGRHQDLLPGNILP